MVVYFFNYVYDDNAMTCFESFSRKYSLPKLLAQKKGGFTKVAPQADEIRSGHNRGAIEIILGRNYQNKPANQSLNFIAFAALFRTFGQACLGGFKKSKAQKISKNNNVYR